jgi:acetyl esterase/lipase
MTMYLGLTLAFSLAADPRPERLWPNEPPKAVKEDIDNPPTLTIYRAAKPNGTAVVVCPGGGYSMLAVGHEGKEIAEWLNGRGVTAAILEYRHRQRGKRPGPLMDAPLLDAQRAIRTVRSRAKDLGVDPHKIGIWGFSAGGHLASTAATHFDNGRLESSDGIETFSCRPDFAILAYPVITFTKPSMHKGSRDNLLGANPPAKLVEEYSNELRVTKNTPPIFLFHTEEDKGVPPENSRLFAAACKEHGVPVELVIVAKGRHGVGLASKESDPELKKWPEKLEAWMKSRGLLGS